MASSLTNNFESFINLPPLEVQKRLEFQLIFNYFKSKETYPKMTKKELCKSIGTNINYLNTILRKYNYNVFIRSRKTQKNLNINNNDENVKQEKPSKIKLSKGGNVRNNSSGPSDTETATKYLNKLGLDEI